MPEQDEKYPFLDDTSDDDPSSANGRTASDDAPADDAPADEADGDDASGEEADGDEASEDDLYYDDDNVGEKLRGASEAQLNSTNFGIIQIDDEGEVLFFNAYESELSGVEPDEARGRNFFTQVAPCTNNRLFRGRFKKGVRRGELDETFTYTYTYKMRPTLVDVRLYRDDAGNNWIMVQKY